MKLLVVLSRVPWPLEKGDKLRAYYLLKEWSKQHSIALFCISDSNVDPSAELKLKEICDEVEIVRISKLGIGWRLFASIFNNVPFQVAYFHSESAQKRFDRFLDSNIPDHIFCQLVRTVKYVSKYTLIPKSLDYMDAFSVGMAKMEKKAAWPLSMLMRSESKRLHAYEVGVQNYFNHRYIISEQDKAQLHELHDLKVVPNGVDKRFFEEYPQDEPKKYDVLFTGNMAYRPNVESAKFLVKEIMPIIWSSRPETTLCLAGATPVPQVKSLASSHVHVTGWVDDIRSVYRQSSVFAAPMIVNTGLQNKLLEAMACRLPTVTTTMANNALRAEPNKEVLIGDNASSIAQAILKLLDDHTLSRSVADYGKTYVEQNFGWSNFAEQFSKHF